MNASKSLLASALLATFLVASPAVNAKVVNLGDITDSSKTAGFSTIVATIPFLGPVVVDAPDTFTFTLNAVDKSDLTIDYSVGLGVNLGTSSGFKLTKVGDGEIGSFNLPDISFLTSGSASFLGLTNGSYALSFIPSNFLTITALGGLKLTATSVTPVPEPETNALMLLGLGLIGFIAPDRKSVV